MIEVVVAIVSYSLGALPFSKWIARWQGVNIQETGSGNPGATNVARSLGLAFGTIVLVLDLAKGAAAAALAQGLETPLILSGFAVIGHNWSVFLHFRGGKGVATTLGVLAVASWPAASFTVGVWLILVALTRKVSLGSVIAVLSAPIILWFFVKNLELIWLFAALGVLSVVKHRKNIRRLFDGEELSLP